VDNIDFYLDPICGYQRSSAADAFAFNYKNHYWPQIYADDMQITNIRIQELEFRIQMFKVLSDFGW